MHTSTLGGEVCAVPTFPKGDARGRPSPAGKPAKQDHSAHVFGDAERLAYVELVRAGMGLTKAAKALGFKPDTVRQARRRLADFDQAVVDAEEEMVEDIELIVVNAAKEGDLMAAKYVLNNRAARRWRDGGPAVQVQVQADQAAVLVSGDPQERRAAVESFRLELEERRAALALPDSGEDLGAGAQD